MLVDAHCHLHEFGSEAERFRNIRIIAVSDDLESSLETISITKRLSNVVPGVGVHPWELGKAGIGEVERVIELAIEGDVRFFGEVGLDRRYYRDIYDLQVRAFKMFIDAAEAGEMALNIHALDAWRHVLDILEGRDIATAIIHWYSGPVDLLDRIRDMGFYITVNPSVERQPKHLRVVEKAPLEILLTESDGPYVYKGVKLEPPMVAKAVKAISSIKGMSVEEVSDLIFSNFRHVVRSVGLTF